ncbi:aspartyl/asparaginyl beta-hydroxylase domain-containing protein [Roseivirga thermotolerans]|uniref:Aspartyl/asparaginy/proline hydroxylase domain-containing protein n=1 Tax=Roseivirga thermotolerans TaxID=1758176 RepID=A0ABQ3I6C9_9BACT|nr:aspartyl/asparaginyl beta-hydroxylase domain-containing protein [Roseivirga thermotolerans]GHE60414.1 hypothetical protein GCM10011340_14070 [Roseivirga thermotolerans]
MTSIKLPLRFNSSLLKQEVDSIDRELYHDIYNPFVDRDMLFSLHLVTPDLKSGGFIPNELLTKFPELFKIYNSIKSDKETYRIHILRSGGVIRRHRDIARNYENGVFRIHIPVSHPNGMLTLLNDKPVDWQEGECWYLDLDMPHEIRNESDHDRIHIVMDCVRNAWWDNIFSQANYTPSFGTGYSRMQKEELQEMKQLLINMNSNANELVIAQIEQELKNRESA